MSQKLMQSVLDGLKGTLIRSAVVRMQPQEAAETTARISQMFDHTMAGGKHQRSGLALNTFVALAPKASKTAIENAAKVVATLEMLQSYFLVLDDIMDQSQTRRGQPCWYTLPHVGLQACNDAVILESGIAKVIREAIPQHPQRDAILATMGETKFKTSLGQFLDGASNTIDHCKWDRYAQIVEHKTSHYSFYTPLALGFHLADVDGYKNTIQPLAYQIGYLFQAQDDFLDVYGDEKVTGKKGTDIANGKCTWLACQTVEKLKEANDGRLEAFSANFGKPEPEKTAAAKKILIEAEVDKDFVEFVNNTSADLHDKIDGFGRQEVKPVLHSLVEALMGRKK
uniref:Farnesyl pyrophosphate synthase n=1 Tax=Panagrellus redivivus TaxID=6233 RepID=A0A7E4W0T4_PANRE